MSDIRYERTRERMRTRLAQMGLKAIEPMPSPARSVPLRCSPMCPICHGDGYYYTHPKARVGTRNYGKIEICPNYRRTMAREEGEVLPPTEFDFVPPPGSGLDDEYEIGEV